MTSIGKVNASAVGMTNELTVAAANFNLDFSLFKVEAPKEYNGVRNVLSNYRLKEAESGQPHMIARRLGALFESIIPPIPHLIKAYGARVSEISAALSDKKQYRPKVGCFTDYAGPNATSIWAAATSGKAALAIHLLACMLARIWKGPEAISLWVEIVERRKREIPEDFENTGSADIASAMASRQPFSRSDLAMWDASARSWLQTADNVKLLQHKQLTLIMNNLRMPVSTVEDPYQSIKKAWLSALTLAEKIVQGVPHRVQDGAILLALSSWHLYPDLQVLLEQAKTVYQGDPLTKGAIITVSSFGIEGREGVYWSLPLSKLQFYSAPVQVEGRVSSETSRVTMREFQIVMLGVIISDNPEGWTPTQCCELLKLALKIVEPHAKSGQLAIVKQALMMMTTAADAYLDALRKGDAQVEKLLALGIRRGKSRTPKTFFQAPTSSGLGFGLGLNFIMSCMGRQELDHADFCQNIASCVKTSNLYLKYKSLALMSKKAAAAVQLAGGGGFVYVAVKKDEDPLRQLSQQGKAAAADYAQMHYIFLPEPESTSSPFPWVSKKRDSMFSCIHRRLYEGICTSPEHQCIGCINREVRSFLDASTETASNSHIKYVYLKKSEESFVQVHGHYPLTLVRLKSDASAEPPGDQESETRSLEAFHLAKAILDFERLVAPALGAEMTHVWCVDDTLRISMLALLIANEIYKTLDGAQVDLSLLDAATPLANFEWARHMDVIWRKEVWPCWSWAEYVNIQQILSCITTLETGGLQIPPKYLQNVIALSTGDSLYVLCPILRDPADPQDRSGVPIRRVLGSLGRPEVAFVTVPVSPMVKDFDVKNWRLINHRTFDGKLEDCFGNTSLHLSFTDYELPIDTGKRGLRDTQAVLLESVVSVIDRGRHIGDLDIISLISEEPNEEDPDGSRRGQGEVVKRHTKARCNCPPKEVQAENSGGHPSWTKLVSLDTWDELLERPSKTGVFRAYQNWEARLAGALISVQLGRRVCVLPSQARLCCLETLDLEKYDVVIA